VQHPRQPVEGGEPRRGLRLEVGEDAAVAAARRLAGDLFWALMLALPVALPLIALWAPASWAGVGWPAIAGLAYVSLFRMLIGFVFWYRGLALGGIAAVGQLQLVQPFLGLALAAGLLHETVGIGLLAASAGVLLCVAGARRFAAQSPP
jgi:drug/metabolite transporter (DMT)-like permease